MPVIFPGGGLCLCDAHPQEVIHKLVRLQVAHEAGADEGSGGGPRKDGLAVHKPEAFQGDRVSDKVGEEEPAGREPKAKAGRRLDLLQVPVQERRPL